MLPLGLAEALLGSKPFVNLKGDNFWTLLAELPVLGN